MITEPVKAFTLGLDQNFVEKIADAAVDLNMSIARRFESTESLLEFPSNIPEPNLLFTPLDASILDSLFRLETEFIFVVTDPGKELHRNRFQFNPLDIITTHSSLPELRVRITSAMEILRRRRRVGHTTDEPRTVLFRLDPQGRIQFIDEGITDYGPGATELIGESFDARFRKWEGNLERPASNRHGIGREVGSDEIINVLRLTPGRHSDSIPIEDQPVFRVNGVKDQTGGVIGILRPLPDHITNRVWLNLKDKAMSEAPVGITISRAQGNNNPLIYVNEGFVQITGYSRHEVIGKDCRFLQGEMTRREPVQSIRNAIENHRDSTVELRNITKEGEVFWNRFSLSPIRDHQGTVTHFVGIQEDITELKEQRQRLRRAEKLAGISVMAGGVMHEINNPNTVIQGNVKFLEHHWNQVQECIEDVTDRPEKLPDDFMQEVPEVLDEIKGASRRIQNIVDQVKAFARHESRYDRARTFDPVPIVHQSLKSIDVDSTVDFNLDNTIPQSDQSPTIHGDPLGLREIIKNLVQNALEAVEGQDEPAVSVTLSRFENSFQIDIRDNGSGIPSEARGRIYEPFFTTKSDAGHIGLGCSVVNGIVERMNGSIEHESEHHGTHFQVELPLAER